MLIKHLSKVLFFCFLFASCAYFNTFHNTKKLYNEAKKERDNRKTDQPTSQELQKYDKTIEKASKILEIYPKSKYVDDALMILGECFYYKGEYIKAQRKFQELITYFPESDFLLQAKIWLARTNMMLEDYTTARLNLTELLRVPKLKRSVQEESMYLLAESYFEQENYVEAAEGYRNTLSMCENDEIKAKAYLRLGECQEINEQYEQAVSSFQNAIKYSSDRNSEFDARLGLCRTLKFAENFKASLKVCSELLENSLFQDLHGYVRLELADCVYREGLSLYDKLMGANVEYFGKVQQALDEYEAITNDFKRTPVAATAFYRMGLIYEEDFGDFPRAMDNYNKVRLEDPKSDLIEESTSRAKDLEDLIRLKDLIRKAQGEHLSSSRKRQYLLTDYELLLLEHGVHPEIRFMERLKKTAKLDVSKLTSEESEKERKQRNLDELVASKLQLAEVYLFQFAQVDSALYEYNEVLKLFPEHKEAVKALYSLAFIYENEFHNKSKTDSLLTVLIDRFPDSYQAEEARRKLGLPLKRRIDPAIVLFHQAEKAWLEHKNIQKAISNYQSVVQTYPNSEYAPKALFALGWIEDQVRQNKERAVEIYKELEKKYPDSDLAKQAAKKLKAFEVANSKETQEQDESKPEKMDEKPNFYQGERGKF